MRIEASLSDVVKVKAFDAMVKEYDSNDPYVHKAECIMAIIKNAKELGEEIELAEEV